MKDIDRMLNPDARFLEYQDYLIDLIASSYHESFKDIIASRIKDAFYCFDSTPDISYQVIKKINPNKKTLIKYFLLSSDYKLGRYVLKKIKKDAHYSNLKNFLSVSDSFFNKNKDIILNLNFEIFSKKISALLLDSSLDAGIREEIMQNRQKYLASCHGVFLEPITNEGKIETYLYYERLLNKTLNSMILQDSFFGRDLIIRLKNTGIFFEEPLEFVASRLIFLDKDNLALTFRMKTKQNKYKTLLAMPVLANTLCKENLDSTLIHELIHVSEISNDNKYQELLFNKKYNFFSEIRTAKKEKELFEKLRQDNIYIFDQDNSLDEPSNCYYNFIPLIRPILDNYRELFDYCAIANKIGPIYKNLGRKNFDDFCESIGTLYNGIMLIGDKFPQYLENIINCEVYDEYMDRFKTYRKTK